MSYLFPTLLTIGLPLVAVPLIIHLINLRRHRRIRWAAMEFLLQSQKKRRKWVILKQLLLLLARMAAFAVVALMLARPVLKDRFGAFFGGAQSHHIVLLDDSYSMGEFRSDGRTVFDDAKDVVTHIAEQAATQGGDQFLTVIRFSEARTLSVGSQPDLYRQAIDLDSRGELEDLLLGTSVSQTDAGPVDAVRAAARLPEPENNEARQLYLVSDFRRRQWEQANEIRQPLARIREQGTQLQFVHCVQDERPNVAIDSLKPLHGIRAAGTEMWMEVTVTNHSDQPAGGITVQVEQDGENRGSIELDTIEPRKVGRAQFRSSFASARPHTLTASLPADTVPTDNQRYAAFDVPIGYPILIIDGTQSGRDGYFLSAAIAPGGAARTSWQPQVEPSSFLHNHERLNEFAAVFLLDVERIAAADVNALEQYVADGGGVGFFLGQNTSASYVNAQLYRDGEGLFPVPLSRPIQHLHDFELNVPDVKVDDHPVFRAFSAKRNSFADMILVEYYYGILDGWSAKKYPQVSQRATVGQQAPLVLEQNFGNGRVVVFLTKLSTEKTSLGRWVNWLANPMFPVMALDTVSYLSQPHRAASDQLVDEQIQLSVPDAEFMPEMELTYPVDGQQVTTSLTASARKGQLVAAAPGTQSSGVYSFMIQPKDAQQTRQQRVFAVNVPTGEGDLRVVDRSHLEEKLEGIPFLFAWSDSFAKTASQLAGSHLSDALLIGLLVLLVCEQMLAYSASYHPGREGAAG